MPFEVYRVDVSTFFIPFDHHIELTHHALGLTLRKHSGLRVGRLRRTSPQNRSLDELGRLEGRLWAGLHVARLARESENALYVAGAVQHAEHLQGLGFDSVDDQVGADQKEAVMAVC
jgi:hypothetical protein